MKKSILIAFAMVLSLTGCYHVVTPPNMQYDISQAKFTKEMKRGEACVMPLLAPYINTDISVKTAALNGKVSKVQYVEIQSGLLTYCTVVYGE